MEITGSQELLKACSEQTGLTKCTNPTPKPTARHKAAAGVSTQVIHAPTDAGLGPFIS